MDTVQLPEKARRADPTTAHTPPTVSAPPRFAVTFIALGALVSALAQSLFVPVLPLLPGLLGTSATNVQWLVTSTVLVGAIAVPIAGRLGDLHGKRLMLLVSLAAMAVGSLITALSSTITWLIIGRSIQGLAAGTVPLGISLVTASVPRHRRASGVALVSGMLGVGGALGLPLAGVIAEYADYHVLFWVTFAATVLAFLGILLRVPEAPVRAAGRLDSGGAVLLAVTLLTLLLPLSEAGVWGWSNPWTWGLLGLSVVLGLSFGWLQWRTVNPLVDVRTLRRRTVLLTDLASILIGFSMFGSILGTSSYIQAPTATGYGFGASVAVAGLALLPSGLAMLLLAPVAGRMILRWGARTTLIAGALIVAAGWMMRMWLISTLAWVIIGTTIVGMGVALCFAAFPALINASVPSDQNATANGLNALFRSLGVSLVSALCGSILASLTIPVGAADVPSLAAYRWIFAICAVGGVVAAAMAGGIAKTHKRSVQTHLP